MSRAVTAGLIWALALLTHPGHRPAILAAAVADLEANRFGFAVTKCESLLALNPDDIEASLLSGLAWGARGHAVRAASLLTRAAQYRGNAAHPFQDLVMILRRVGRAALIEAQFDALNMLAPGDHGLVMIFAEFLYDSGRFEEAVTVLAEARRLRPEHPPTGNLLAMSFAALGRTDAAIATFRAAIRLSPESGELWANLGLLLKDDGHFEEALAAYNTAVNLAPNNARIRVNRVVARLRAGLWSEAWPDYEQRLKLSGQSEARDDLLPAISSLPELRGRTILAVHEDGFGDTLHFARYLPLLAERGALVLASVPPPLRRIMLGVPGVSAVYGPDERPNCDFQCPFFSLPRAFETTPDTIPAPIPYLAADPALVEIWRSRLPSGAPLVGLVWAGQARPDLPGFATLDARRSMALAQLSPFGAVPGVVFVSLQHGPTAVQARTPPRGMTLIDPTGGVTDFADTAAIIAHLDLVVSVDTSVVHLAGGMGKPVFLLDRYDHCWRWLSGRCDSPWYPGLRIFRQPAIGDWDFPVKQAVGALVASLRDRPRGNTVGVDLLKIPKTIQGDA